MQFRIVSDLSRRCGDIRERFLPWPGYLEVAVQDAHDLGAVSIHCDLLRIRYSLPSTAAALRPTALPASAKVVPSITMCAAWRVRGSEMLFRVSVVIFVFTAVSPVGSAHRASWPSVKSSIGDSLSWTWSHLCTSQKYPVHDFLRRHPRRSVTRPHLRKRGCVADVTLRRK